TFKSYKYSYLAYIAEEPGIPASVELCVKALQLPKQDDSESKISVCKTVSCLLPDDLEVLRACQLTEFLLGPAQEAFSCLEELYLRPDQKYDQDSEVIPNSLRCELLLALKAYWPFDPEFWDWKTLKYHCISLLGLSHEQLDQKQSINQTDIKGDSEAKKQNFCCHICKRSISDTQVIHHSKRHAEDNNHPCPICLEKFESRKKLVPHIKKHIESETHLVKNHAKTEEVQKTI
uniref:C2H2-type domain-containing protein n=1 Tax=Astatotilapia calliptera TaxID=8154 RepID=A0AAX7SD01_ASTCA